MLNQKVLSKFSIDLKFNCLFGVKEGLQSVDWLPSWLPRLQGCPDMVSLRRNVLCQQQSIESLQYSFRTVAQFRVNWDKAQPDWYTLIASFSVWCFSFSHSHWSTDWVVIVPARESPKCHSRFSVSLFFHYAIWVITYITAIYTSPPFCLDSSGRI